MHLFFLDTEPTISVLYGWSGICMQWGLCSYLFFPTTSSKSIVIFNFSFLCILSILLNTLLLVTSHTDICTTHHFVIVFFIVCFTHKHLLSLHTILLFSRHVLKSCYFLDFFVHFACLSAKLSPVWWLNALGLKAKKFFFNLLPNSSFISPLTFFLFSLCI